ncbi:MAG: hypothetical protein ACE5OZ_25855 [Candidatus Heimdallarchaeota archaeon]
MPFAGFIYQEAGGTPLLVIAMILNLAILALLFATWIRTPPTMINPASTSVPAR